MRYNKSMKPVVSTLTLWALFACDTRDDGQVQIVRETSSESVGEWGMTIDDATLSWLARASLDLRGKRPTSVEIEDVLDGTVSANELIEAWMEEPDFARQQAWYWNDAFHTAVWMEQEEKFRRFMLSDEEHQSLGFEPMAFIEQVLLDRRPFTDVVTTSSVPSNPVLSDIFGDSTESDDWDWVTPEREHPSAGVLGSRVLWMRQYVDFLNHNRARANFVTSTFLCMDYLEREVVFDFSNISLDAVETAIQTQPECVACHASLDPLASVLGAFQDGVNLELDQMGMPSSFKERWFAGWKEPNYFGQPMNSISDLGAYLAVDARFSQCVVKRTWEALVPEQTLSDLDVYALTSYFVESDYDLRDVLMRIVASPQYREQPKRVLRPEQLYGVLLQLGIDPNSESGRELSGIVWSPERRVMFGSTDDVGVLSVNPAFTVGHHVQLEWISNQLMEIVRADINQSIDRRQVLTIYDSPGSVDSVRRQVTEWKRTLHADSIDRDDPELDRLVTLWQQVATQDEVVAWSTVLAILVHDPKMVLR